MEIAMSNSANFLYRIWLERYFFWFVSMLELVKNSCVYAETYIIVNDNKFAVL